MEPQENSASLDQTFTVNITIREVQNLYGVGVSLTWNSSVLRPTNIDVRFEQVDGVLHNPVYIAENYTLRDRYILSATSTNPAPSFDGSGTVVRITFKVTENGGSKLDLESQLYDYPPASRDPRISLPISHITVDGFVHEVIPEFPNLIVLLTFLTTALATCCILKKMLTRLPGNRTSRTKAISRQETRKEGG